MLTAIILAKNEEANIERAIKSVGFANEVIVFDDHSSDKTKDIAKNLGARVIESKLDGDFATQRNKAMEVARNDWILFLDADEYVSPKLATEIKRCINEDKVGYYIPRYDMLYGRKITHGECLNFKILRLGKKNKGTWKGKVHEVWTIKGKVGDIKNEIIHYPHPTMKEYIDEIEFYSTLHAKQKYDGGEKSSLIKIIFFPPLKFIYNYVIKLGFLDGDIGFIQAMMMSFHSYLSWSKLWLMQRKLEYKKY